VAATLAALTPEARAAVERAQLPAWMRRARAGLPPVATRALADPHGPTGRYWREMLRRITEAGGRLDQATLIAGLHEQDARATLDRMVAEGVLGVEREKRVRAWALVYYLR
jgi:hypothetical protein